VTPGGPEAIIEVAEEPVTGITRLRDIEPPPALVARVMTKVSDPATPSVWNWLWRPIRVELRVSPIGILTLGIIVAVGLALFVAR